jgi:hypothetical protein
MWQSTCPTRIVVCTTNPKTYILVDRFILSWWSEIDKGEKIAWFNWRIKCANLTLSSMCVCERETEKERERRENVNLNNNHQPGQPAKWLHQKFFPFVVAVTFSPCQFFPSISMEKGNHNLVTVSWLLMDPTKQSVLLTNYRLMYSIHSILRLEHPESWGN